jgi:TPP-dependent pyruvate/acetoin dehydrogenase alpha subunit
LVHPYIGQEAIAVGVCVNLKQNDYITSTHRGHGHCIAKGGELKPMMAELFGKRTGYCKGKGGSMHIAAFDKGILGAMGIVGSGGPIAVGAALGIKNHGDRRSQQQGEISLPRFAVSILFIISPAIMVFPAPGSSAIRKRMRGY